jgi:hypothetical protein
MPAHADGVTPGWPEQRSPPRHGRLKPRPFAGPRLSNRRRRRADDDQRTQDGAQEGGDNVATRERVGRHAGRVQGLWRHEPGARENGRDGEQADQVGEHGDTPEAHHIPRTRASTDRTSDRHEKVLGEEFRSACWPSISNKL